MSERTPRLIDNEWGTRVVGFMKRYRNEELVIGGSREQIDGVVKKIRNGETEERRDE